MTTKYTHSQFISSLDSLTEYADRIDFMIENIDRLSTRDQIRIAKQFEDEFTNKYKGSTQRLLTKLEKISEGISQSFENVASNKFTGPQAFTLILRKLLELNMISLGEIEEKRQMFSDAMRFFPVVRKIKGNDMSDFLQAFEKYMEDAPIRVDLSHYWVASHLATKDTTLLLENPNRRLRRPYNGRKLF